MISLVFLQLAASVVGSDHLPSTPMDFQRDENFNRVVIAGSASDRGQSVNTAERNGRRAAGRATAIANMINVTVYGSNNTVVVHARQQNSGTQQAIVGVSPSTGGAGM